MQHQTVPQTRVIKARYLTAGMAVLRKTSYEPLTVSVVRRDDDTVLVSFDGTAGEGAYHVEDAVTVVDAATTIQGAAGTVRVTFDVMAGIEPITFPAATATDQVAYQVQRAFVAADDMHPENAQVAIDVEAGTVVVSADGDVIEHGSITRVDEQPAAEVDLRRVAYDLLVAGVAAGMPIPADISIATYHVFELKMADNDQASVDAWVAHLGLPAPTPGKAMKGSKRHFRSYESATWDFPPLPGWKVAVDSYIDEPAEDGTR